MAKRCPVLDCIYGWGKEVRRSPIKFGDYVITRRIARGGMAEIFRARTVQDSLHRAQNSKSHQAAPPKWVAIKMMRGELENHELRQKLFEREANIVTAIRHPNVVPVFESGENLGRQYLAMEYFSGKNLAQISGSESREQSGPLPLDLCLYIGQEASAGLGYAHNLRNSDNTPMDIVHRDISPGNIMVSYDGRVKLLDFGVARMNETNGIHTQTGTLRGKFAYISPEQTLGSNVDARSDVFAFGIVLYELLTGNNPFRGASPIASLDRVQRHRPAPPSQVIQGLPRSLNQVLAKCLAKDPRRRYRDGSELHQALLQFSRSHRVASKADAVRYLDIHFQRDRWREEKQLESELEQVAAVEILDFNLTQPSNREMSDPHLIQAAALEEASHAEIIAAVSGLLDSTPQAENEPQGLKTLRYIAANVQEPLDDDSETALDTVFEENFAPPFSLELPVDAEERAGIPTVRHPVLPRNSFFTNVRYWGLGIAGLLIAFFLVFKPEEPINKPSVVLEATTPAKQAQTSATPSKELPITTLDPITIDLPTPKRAKTTTQKKLRKTSKGTNQVVRTAKWTRVRTNSFGYLNVGAKPWAHLEINGKKRAGRTPHTGIKLTTGVHAIHVQNPHTGIKRTVRVEIMEGKYKTLNFDLRNN